MPGLPQQPLRHLNVEKRLGGQDGPGVCDRVQGQPEPVLPVLLPEPIPVPERRQKAHQHPPLAGLQGSAPALLATDDLVAATVTGQRLHLDERLV